MTGKPTQMIFFLLLSLQPFLFVRPAAAAGNLTGDWKTPDDSVIRIYPCGTNLCGKVIQFAGSVFVDQMNPDQTLRDRAICGLEIAKGWKPTSASKAEDGTIYDPNNGKTYRSTITADADTLQVRGYAGVFFRTETWRRPAEAPAPCRR